MIYAAPFCGEFGWLCALWVPWLRHHKQTRIGIELTVVCEPGQEALFTDFADKIVTKEIRGTIKRDCNNAWLDGTRLRAADYHHIVEGVIGRRVAPKHVLTPDMLPYQWGGHGPPRPTKLHRFHDYSFGNSFARDLVVIHARFCKDKQPERNWSRDKWLHFLELLGGDPVLIGSKDGSMTFPMIADQRGNPLASDIETLSRAKVVIGPSSGPLHLANQCKAPVVWWSPNSKDVERYASAWNPFGVPNVRAAQSWDPTVEQVMAAVKTCISSS